MSLQLNLPRLSIYIEDPPKTRGELTVYSGSIYGCLDCKSIYCVDKHTKCRLCGSKSFSLILSNEQIMHQGAFRVFFNTNRATIL